jgi:UDP-glucose 4-epimerase
MNILVTGAAGFIGSHLVEQYRAAGHSVAALDDLSGGKRENLLADVPFYEVSITDSEAVRQAFAEFKPDIISHHAAQTSVVVSTREPIRDAMLNVVGTATIVTEAIKAGVSKIIYPSSGGTVYGVTDQLPCPETAPINPFAPYALTKHVGEMYLRMYAQSTPLRFTVLRYGNIFGPRQDPHGEAGVCSIFTGKLLNGEKAKIFGDGSQARDYVFIDDVVKANIIALEKGDGGSYNIGTGIGTTTLEVYEAVRKAVGTNLQPDMAPPRAGDVQAFWLDPSLAAQELDWKAEVPFEEGVRRTVEWFRSKQEK